MGGGASHGMGNRMHGVAWAAACLGWHGQPRAYGGMGSHMPWLAWAAVPSVLGRGVAGGGGASHGMGGCMPWVAWAAACLGWHGQLRA